MESPTPAITPQPQRTESRKHGKIKSKERPDGLNGREIDARDEQNRRTGDPRPCRDKFTLFQTAEDMADSRNAGVLFLGGDKIRVRLADVQDYDLSQPNALPQEIEQLILTIRSKYAYLYQ